MSDSDAVVARHKGFVGSFATGDVSVMADFLTEDHVGMPPGRPQIVGRAGAQEFWREGFSTADSEFTSHSQDITMAGSVAVDRFRWNMVVTPHDGSPRIEDTGKCVWVWRRDPDGEWRVATAIWNSDQSQPTPWTGG